ncbi:flagellar hook protein FlgE [Hephaestia mangrovi]|uniref:flagellar hook protein FlgE n=1 Tax=Hephaestia mangrovi TaxID=2873268 RepID=UPI001CA6269A|nr:flagellar hook protein FlgE [Hephaestia mangrovi]MBY8829278.1 flagellar hook protein FlgE [Hephaestia mangrovi]
MSFYTSLSGLQASQTDMSTISNNLANSATSGFKRSSTEFADVMASSLSSDPNSLIGSGVAVKDTRQQFSEGNLIQSQSSLDLAISGDGFFAVKPQVDGTAVNYTRNGSFLVDADGYVTDSQGGHLQVYPVDGSGAVVAAGGDSLISLQLPETSGVPIATQNVALDVNFNSASIVPSDSTDFDPVSNPYSFDRFDPTTYNQSTQTTIYDASGNAQTMTSYYVRDGQPDASGNTTWSVYSFVGDQQLTTNGGDASPVQLTFDSTGAMTSPTSATSFDTFTPTGSTTAQALSLDFSGSTQLTSPFNVNSRTQDGKSVGQLSGVTVDDTGMVKASFSNGDSQILGKVAIANFNNPTGLRQMGNSYWQSTGISGAVKYGMAGDNGYGSLMSGTVEGSNVDITQELVDLIAAQQNFQANAKALDTSNQVAQTIFNIR